MSASVPVCELDQELRTRLNKIKRLSTKSGIAIIMKVGREYILFLKSAENALKSYLSNTPKHFSHFIFLNCY